MSILKTKKKFKTASDKFETKQNNLYFTRKFMGRVHKGSVTIKHKNIKYKKFAYFLKTIDIKLMKNIRNRLKTSYRLLIT